MLVGAARLEFDPRYQTFFDADDPQRLAFEHLREVFTPSDNVAFVVDPGPGGLFTASTLALLEDLTAEGWQLPYATRVESLTNFTHSEADGDDVFIGPLVEDASRLDPRALALIEAMARSDPMLSGRLVEVDGDLTAVVVTVMPRGDPLESNREIMSAARELKARIVAEHPEVDVHLAGIVAMNHAFSESSQQDSLRLLPLMLVLMLIGLRVLLASWPLVVATFGVMIVAVAGALGAAGWLGMELTTPSALAPIIIVTVVVADCVHIGLATARGEGALAARLRAALDEHHGPVLLTTFTTAAGFLSMNFSAVPPFRDLGNLVAMGVVLAGVLSLWLLPALVMLLPEARRRPTWVEAMGRSCAALATPRSGRRLVLGGLVVVLLLPGLARLGVNDDFVGYFAPSQPFRQAAELVDARLGGMYEIEYQLLADSEGGIHSPAWLAEVDAFATWLREQPETAHVLTYTDVLKRLNRTLAGGAPQAHALPESAEEAAQYLLLYELSLPLGLDVTNMVAQDYGSVRLLVSLRDVDSRRVLAFEERAGAWLAEHAPAVTERHGGINLMFAHISERNVAAMFEGNLFAVLVIGALLAVALRAPGLALLSLVTNLLPVALAFAVWGWLVADLGLAVSAAFGMTLGIVVDDTVHLLTRYRRLRVHADVATAVRSTLATVGPALVVTTLILLVGFAALALSSFALNALLAQITLLTIVLALLVDLLLLPAWLMHRASVAPQR
ncbi:MAG: MMPL family transporter [Gammaproteobacteria bacterium]|nr:MMPL family transporter [Gammaproteobacteria bacterium]